jgi:hypothetical protein
VEQEVIQLVKNLKNSSAGWDSISAQIIKDGVNYLLKPMTHVLNMSLSTGIFPREMKIARVIPIFKSGNTMLFNNYRPVSVLPIFSKVYERIMYKRLISFINTHKLLYEYQFGFREGHSTNLAIVYLVDKISQALDNGEYVIGLYLDFSKAFDTVDHKILLQKLEHYGIRGVALDWFKSYLENRKQCVDINGTLSDLCHLSCGVPQGSILGPILFLLYINDLSRVSHYLFSLLFADDSNMFASGTDPNELIKNTNIEIEKIMNWLHTNKLTLNIGKTHFMIFKNSKKKINLTEKLMIQGHEIELVKSTKFLGIILDSDLSWCNHINFIKNKVSKNIGILCRARKILKLETLVTLYYSFIYPLLTYCIEAWGNASMCYVNTISKLQKRALRIITRTKWSSPSSPIFKDLKILNLSQLSILHTQLFMYKFFHKKLPNIFGSFFQENRNIHSHNTRHQCNYHTPSFRLQKTSKIIRYTGVKSHALFSNTINYNCHISTYKKHVINLLLEKGTDFIDTYS